MPLEQDMHFHLGKAFLARVQEEKESVRGHMESGQCKDYAVYQHCVGQLQGLRVAEIILKELVDAWESR